MSSKGVTLNTNSRNTIKFGRRFLRVLMQIKRNRSGNSCSSSVEEIQNRSRRVKIAAYSSMARVVGSRRAWSRAVLFKLRSRAKHQGLMRRRRGSLGVKKKKRGIKNDPPPSGELKQANKLRQLVPGGKTMDMCCLLDETAHFVKCLATQVKVMQIIADHFSK